MSQKILLRIVQTWKLNKKPEYRGFRCANCQKYLYKAWHHWCIKGGYKTPVHFCNNCESDFKLSNINIIKPKISADRTKFNLKFPERIKIKLKKITDSWNISTKPVYKTFTCDDCGENMHKAYHLWFKMNRILIEAHFCKKCGDKEFSY